MKMRPQNFMIHAATGKRFHVTEGIADKFQVYALGPQYICQCDSVEVAEMIAAALESAAEQSEGVTETLASE